MEKVTHRRKQESNKRGKSLEGDEDEIVVGGNGTGRLCLSIKGEVDCVRSEGLSQHEATQNPAFDADDDMIILD